MGRSENCDFVPTIPIELDALIYYEVHGWCVMAWTLQI